MPHLKRSLIGLALLFGIPSWAAADTIDQAICAVEQVTACPAFEPCERTLPGAVDLPALIKIDRTAKVVVSQHGNGEMRTSPIGFEAESDDALILQGMEDGLAWSMRVSLETERFAFVAAREDIGFTAFGVCSSSLLEDAAPGEAEQ